MDYISANFHFDTSSHFVLEHGQMDRLTQLIRLSMPWLMLALVITMHCIKFQS